MTSSVEADPGGRPNRPYLIVIGRDGQVGKELERMGVGDWKVDYLSRRDVDLSNLDRLREFIRARQPDMVINAAAYTAVDDAETEPELCFRINAEAPGALAECMSQTGGLLVHYSTDYVFDGRSRVPYRETDRTAPTGVYGASKLAGEEAIAATGCRHLIFRTSWVYSYRGRNFLRTMLRLAGEGRKLRVVADQRGTPTYAGDLARMTVEILRRVLAPDSDPPLGLFHLGNAGEATWHEFACEILARRGYDPDSVTAITTADFPTRAQRPAYSVLDKSKAAHTFGIDIPHWLEGLDRCLAEL